MPVVVVVESWSRSGALVVGEWFVVRGQLWLVVSGCCAAGGYGCLFFLLAQI